MTSRFQLPSFSSASALLTTSIPIGSAALTVVGAADASGVAGAIGPGRLGGAALAALAFCAGPLAGHSETTPTIVMTDATPAARILSLRFGVALPRAGLDSVSS